MLDYLRRNTQSLAVKIILGLIAVVFIFFMGGGGGLIGGSTTLAEIGDRKISLNEYRDARQRTEQYYRDQYGDRLTPELLSALDIPSLALNQLVDGAILEEEALRLGLSVPDEALRYEIREIQAFQQDGQFSPTAYRNLLQRQGLSPAQFERNVRQQMLVEQLVDVIRRGVHVTEDEAFDAYRHSADKMTLEFVKVSAADLQSTVGGDGEGLAAYYKENQETYRIAEGAKVRYLAYTAVNFSSPDLVSDEDIESYYELNKDSEFTIEEQVGARHILKKFPADADDDAKAEVRAAIDAVVARLNAGEDFAEVAKEESEDGSAASGGDLGKFGRGRMVAPFEQAAFDLEVGGISDVVESQFGYHVITVYSHDEGRVKPLAEVRDEIANELAAEQAKDTIFDAAADDALAIQDGVTMETIAEERELTIQTSGVLRSGAPVPEIDGAAPFVATALELQLAGDTSEAVRVGDSYYILSLVERTPSSIPALDDVRELVDKDYRRELAAKAARAKADEILAAIKGGKTPADFEGQAAVTIEETQPFTQAGGFIGGVGNLPAAKQAAFEVANDGDVLPRTYALRGDAFVFMRKSYEQASREDFDLIKDERIAVLRRQRETQAVNEFVRSLKEQTEITFDQALLATYVQ